MSATTTQSSAAVSIFEKALVGLRKDWKSAQRRGDSEGMAGIERTAAVLKEELAKLQAQAAAGTLEGIEDRFGAQVQADLDGTTAYAARERQQEAAAFASDPDMAPHHMRAAVAPATLPETRYTVVFGDRRITIRIREGFVGRDGTRTPQTVGYLFGSDNENSYKQIGFFVNGQFKPWAKHAGSGIAQLVGEAVKVVVGDPEAAREAYALESSRCARCNRVLTVPASIHRGLGPECASKI